MENFSFENINKSRKENILKSFDSNIYDAPLSDIDQEISKAIELDVIEKGRKGATIGEIREWSGKKYQKTAQGWIPYKGKGLSHGDVDVTGQKDTPIPKEGDSEDKYKGKTKSGKEYDLRHNTQHDKHKDHYNSFSSQDHKELADAHKKLSEEPNQTNKTFHQISANHHNDKAKEEVKDLLGDVKSVVKDSKTADEAFDKIKAMKNVSVDVSKLFHEKYSENGKLSPKQAVQKMFDEVHAEKKEEVKPKEDKKDTIFSNIKSGDIVQFVKKTDKEDIINGEILRIDENDKMIYFKNLDYPDVGTHGMTADSVSKYYNIVKKEDSKPKDIKKQHKDLIDKKDYVGASKLLVDTYGTDEEKKKINDFIEADKKGETTEAGYKEFDSIVQKYSKEVEKKPRKPRTKKADMLIKEGNVKTQYPDIDFDKVPKEVADDFAEKIQDASFTMDEFFEAALGENLRTGQKREPQRWDPELSKEQVSALKELYEKDLKGIDKVKEFDKIVKDEYNYDSDKNVIKDAINAHKEIKEKYPDASTTKDKDQLRLFKSLNEAKKDHISKSILGY